MHIPKEPAYRDKELLELHRGRECYLQVPGVCRRNFETVVPCHSPFGEDRHGSQKADDWCAVPGCMDCHDFLDNRTYVNVPRYEKLAVFNAALKKWIKSLFREAIVSMR